MIENTVKIGFDRFLALDWADYSLELFLNSENEAGNYQLLKEYLGKVISGEDSARKTSNQLKRLWLNSKDEFHLLRLDASTILKQAKVISHSAFHLGMAINVFPIFQETCRKIGEISKVQPCISRKTIVDRVSQTFLNPSSIPRIVSRVIQTLEDWQFLEVSRDEVRLRKISLESHEESAWVIQALMCSQGKTELPITSINNFPEKLGIEFLDFRQTLHQSSQFSVRRNANGEEMIARKIGKYS